jgi:hypothetical protein
MQVGAGGMLERVISGRFCGVVPVNATARYPHPTEGIPGGGSTAGCDGRDQRTPPEPTNFDDVMIAGSSILGIRTQPVQPDVDLDGDGLETYETLTTGATGCQPVVVACIDGDGTRIEGDHCDEDPRMADGHSVSFSWTAVVARIIGVHAGMKEPGGGCR